MKSRAYAPLALPLYKATSPFGLKEPDAMYYCFYAYIYTDIYVCVCQHHVFTTKNECIVWILGEHPSLPS